MNLLNAMILVYSFCNAIPDHKLDSRMDRLICIQEKKACVQKLAVQCMDTNEPNGKRWPITVKHCGYYLYGQYPDSDWTIPVCFKELMPALKITKEFDYQGASFTQQVELEK